MLPQQSRSIQEKLKELTSEEGTPCLSIVIPAAGLSSNPDTRKAYVLELAREAYTQLKIQYPSKARSLIECVDSFIRGVEWNASPFGLGIYASIKVQHIINLPFEVTEKVLINNHFALPELLYAQQLSTPYFLVLLDDKQARVLYGELDQLHQVLHRLIPSEIKTALDRLPGKRTRTAGISPMSVTYTNHARERKDVVFQEIDRVLEEYATETSLIIVCGSKWVAVPFVNRTKHAEQITSVIYDNATEKEESELVTSFWPDLLSCFHEKVGEELEVFEVMRGEGRALPGLATVWAAVMEDQGATLLVERDYTAPAFLARHSERLLYLSPPPIPHIAIPDAVDLLLVHALKKGLKVVITENNRLLTYDHIGLITSW